jgi:two-component system phosphate regulon sensor histidine kinase PhoR
MLASQLLWRLLTLGASLAAIWTILFGWLLWEQHRAALERLERDRLRHDAAIILRLQAMQPDGASFAGLPTRIETTPPVDLEFLPAARASTASDSAVRQALSTGEGFAELLAPSTGERRLLYALRLGPAEAPRGVLLVARPAPLFDTRPPIFKPPFWGAALLVFAVGSGLTYFVVRRITRPLELLTAAARQVAAGESPQLEPVRSRNEIGTLAQAFASMNRQLTSRIADLQEQRRRLQQNKQQLETVLEAMVEGVIAVDDQERVLLANHAAFCLLDTTPTAMVGRPIWEALRQPRIDALVRQALHGESPQRFEFQVMRSQNTISAVVSRLPGEPCPGAVLVLHDVTELRRLERLRREFVANVSHELKTPLTSIAAYAETLLDGALDDPAHNKQFVQCIEEQTDRLQTLIGDLLSLARMEAEEAAFELTAVDVAEILIASAEAHHAVAESKGIRLTVERTDQPAEAFADAEGVRTIVDNLLDNALNYTPTGGRVSLRCFSDGDWLQIDVSDTGVGIALEHQARIFERFFRVDKARSRELGGTGLGLSIVKHLCQAFGGSVSVTSQLGLGSTFSVRLKRAAAKAVA